MSVMNPKESMLKKAAGFTIIEILIAALLAGIITSAAMALYLTQRKQLFVQEEVSDMQASIRAAMSELNTKIRMAGYNVPDDIIPIMASNTDPDTITIIYDSGILRGVQLEHDMPSPSVELRCDGHDLTGLNEGDWVYIYDPIAKKGEFFQVTAVQYSDHIQHNTMPLSRAYKTGSKVLKLDRYKYYIDQTDANHPKLMVQFEFYAPVVYAENITNLDFKYLLSSGSLVDVPPNPYMVGEVATTVEARNDKPDEEFVTPYRTRSLNARVKVRNLGPK
jgi:hypothetical protein